MHIPNTAILGIQKHLCWPVGCTGMGVWGATPEPLNMFWLCAFQTPLYRVSKTTFARLWGAQVWVFGAPPENHSIFSGLAHSKRPYTGYPKTPLLASGEHRYECLGRHPRTQGHFLAFHISNTPILGIQKHVCSLVGCTIMAVWGAILEPLNTQLTPAC